MRRESSVDVLSNRRQLWKGYISDPHIVVAMWFVDQHLFTEPELDQALTYPRRVLYWGRKSCVPSGDIYRGSVFANSPVDALKGVSGLKFNKFLVPLDGPVPPGSSLVQMSSNRDWRVDRHGGNSVYQVVLP